MCKTLNLMEKDNSGKPKPVILTCAQPTGKLTIGNFLGAIRNWSEMLEQQECYFGIVDLHAITTPSEPAILRQNVFECVAQYIACGQDSKVSSVCSVTCNWPYRTCMDTYLHHPDGELQRMTQFKDKAAKLGFKTSEQKDGEDIKFEHQGARAQASINAGLLCYPVLMAADILALQCRFGSRWCRSGQHLELCRDLAQKFNHQYSDTFVIPEPYVPKTGSKIMSLAEPTRKMSKSDNNERATLFILDEPDQIRKKIASAVTDSGSEISFSSEQPGISNLLTSHSALSEKSGTELEEHFAGKGYGDLKSELTELINDSLEPIRSRYKELIDDKAYLKSVLKEGAAAAQKRAYKILSKVYRKVGFPERDRN